MKINVGLSALDNLIAQILEDNVGQTLTASQFTPGAVSVFVEGGNDRNSEITLTAVPGEGYTGSKVFHFTRLALDTGTAVPVTSVEVVALDDQAASLAKVITAMGLVAAEVDASDYTAPVDEDTDGMITLTPKAGSLLYVGAPVIILLTLPVVVEPDMGTTFGTSELNGFEPEAGV